MTETTNETRKPAAPAKSARQQRLEAQLRANLQKRKAQARARRSGEADGRPEGLHPAGSASDK